MGRIIEQLSQRAQEQDDESLRTRLLALFGEEGAQSVITTPLEGLAGKTPEEVVLVGSDEEKLELERFLTFVETRPWYLDQSEAPQG